jgi:hypothetical protein
LQIRRLRDYQVVHSILHIRRLPVPSPRAPPIWYTGPHPKNKESEFEKLARLIKEEGEDIRTDVRDQIGGLRTEVHDQIGGLRKEMQGFAAISRAVG